MRNLSQNEIFTLNSLLRMEVNELAVAKAVVRTVDDDTLRKMTEMGINTCEARIRSIQQFLSENQIIAGGVQ